MTTSTPGGASSRLSVPPKFAAPRPLTGAEVGTLRAIVDVLIPASGDNPAATSEPDFDAWLGVRLTSEPTRSAPLPPSSPGSTAPDPR